MYKLLWVLDGLKVVGFITCSYFTPKCIKNNHHINWSFSKRTIENVLQFSIHRNFCFFHCTIMDRKAKNKNVPQHTRFLIDSLHPINNLSVKQGRVFLGWTSTKLGLMCLAQGHNAETLVRLKPVANRSRVKHSTTEPLSSLHTRFIENTRWVSFDIKFTRQGFENACWHCEACRAIQHAFSKPSLVNLISKDASLVFYFSVYPLLNTLQTSDYDVIFDFCVDSVSLATSFKKCNIIMTW